MGVEGRSVGSIEAVVEEPICTVDLATRFSSATQDINMMFSMQRAYASFFGDLSITNWISFSMLVIESGGS